MAKRMRPRVEFTETQQQILGKFEAEFQGKRKVWLQGQIKWRKELVERYNAEIAEFEQRLAEA